ncbi:MAG: ferritin family protein [Acidobacteriota bacterium]|jgi:rubrerythrin
MIDPNMMPIDILRMALEREKEAYEFYSEAARISSHAPSKNTFLEMAAEEKRHIHQIEEELDRYFQGDN